MNLHVFTSITRAIFRYPHNFGWVMKHLYQVRIVRHENLFQKELIEYFIVAEPPELSRLKCAGHHHKGNTDSNALQMEQFLVRRVTSRLNHRFSDRTSIPRTKASPEILQPHILQHKHSSDYNMFQSTYYRSKLSKTVIQVISLTFRV